MSKRTFYVTTPIYYVNDKPHLGTTYTTVMCDIAKRYHEMLGYEAFLLTGTDEHGEKILREAQKRGMDVQDLVNGNSERFRQLWPKLEISNDDFIRTTEERHKKIVTMILQRAYDCGDIYMAEYGGNYCVGCERFYTDKDVEANPGFCPDHGTPLEYIAEKNYFFRLGKYQDWLRAKIENDPEILGPAQYRSEILALLRDPLEDLCISRPVERMSWGIPLPFDKDYVAYVWYDALLNYLTGIGYPDGLKWEAWWGNSMHVTAKDILRQHAVYWPCILQSAGIPCYTRLRVHGWWTVEGRKMSKSFGNVIDPMDEANKYGLDVFRYFVARDMSFGSDSDYSKKALIGRNNAELGNDLGNLLSRVTAMIVKYCDGKMPAIMDPTEADKALMGQMERLLEELPGHLSAMMIHTFLEKVMSAVSATNGYITEQAPWAAFKKGEKDRVGTILATACFMLASAAQYLQPVMPGKMKEMQAALGIGEVKEFHLEPVKPGTPIMASGSLFPRLEMEEEKDEEKKDEGGRMKDEKKKEGKIEGEKKKMKVER